VVRFFLLIVGLHVVGAYVHEVRANLQHFTYIWKVFFLDDGPVLGGALPKHFDYLNLIFKHYENAPVAAILRVSSEGDDPLFEVHVLHPLVLDEIIYAHERGVGDQEGAAAEHHRIK